MLFGFRLYIWNILLHMPCHFSRKYPYISLFTFVKRLDEIENYLSKRVLEELNYHRNMFDWSLYWKLWMWIFFNRWNQFPRDKILLFLSFNNDISPRLTTRHLLFVDYLKILSRTVSFHKILFIKLTTGVKNITLRSTCLNVKRWKWKIHVYSKYCS